MKEKYHSRNRYEVFGEKLRVYYRKEGYFDCSVNDLDLVRMSTWRDTDSGPRGYIYGKEHFLRDYTHIVNWRKPKDHCNNKITNENGYLKVWFTNGEGYFICDKEDLDIVLSRTWHKSTSGKGYAAARFNRKYVFFHQLVCKCNEGEEVDHINRNSLDNRRANLRSVTHSENMMNRDFSFVEKWRKRVSVES